MASDLYETLGLDKSAAPEQSKCRTFMRYHILLILNVKVRKAYKKKALATHPDRLPPNASEEEKQQANERFRKVCTPSYLGY